MNESQLQRSGNCLSVRISHKRYEIGYCIRQNVTTYNSPRRITICAILGGGAIFHEGKYEATRRPPRYFIIRATVTDVFQMNNFFALCTNLPRLRYDADVGEICVARCPINLFLRRFLRLMCQFTPLSQTNVDYLIHWINHII